MTTRRLVAVAVAAALLVAAPGCVGDDAGPAADPTAGSTVLAEPSTAPSTAPTTTPALDGPVAAGHLVEATPRPAPAGARAWTVRYGSEGVGGTTVEVSGVVIAPDGPAPPGGRAVVAWAHGTVGSADQCAPSRRAALTIPALETLLAAGFVVAATDYEGLGTPGPHPYLVPASEGRSVLDAARSAADLPEAGASDQVVLWGHSQGAHAVLAAAALAPSYAPELDVLGVAAAAPAAAVSALLPVIAESPFLEAYYLLAVAGLAAADPTLPVAELLTPLGAQLLPDVERQCLQPLALRVAQADAPVAAPGAAEAEPWADLVRRADVGQVPLPIPVRLDVGGRDELVPPRAATALAARLCGPGSAGVQEVIHPDADHVTVVVAGGDDAVAWLADRVAGRSAPSTCGLGG